MPAASVLGSAGERPNKRVRFHLPLADLIPSTETLKPVTPVFLDFGVEDEYKKHEELPDQIAGEKFGGHHQIISYSRIMSVDFYLTGVF